MNCPDFVPKTALSAGSRTVDWASRKASSRPSNPSVMSKPSASPGDANPAPLDKSEGDINLSPLRREWAQTHIDNATRRLLERDADCFLHQTLSTPCLNVIDSASGASFTDAAGRRYLDFHGNNVHQVGFAHPRVIAAIKEQL